MIPIIEKEVQAAIFSASHFKGPGYDRLPAVAWQKTWPVFRSHLACLFEESLRGTSARYIENNQNHPAKKTKQKRLHVTFNLSPNIASPHAEQS